MNIYLNYKVENLIKRNLRGSFFYKDLEDMQEKFFEQFKEIEKKRGTPVDKPLRTVSYSNDEWDNSQAEFKDDEYDLSSFSSGDTVFDLNMENSEFFGAMDFSEAQSISDIEKTLFGTIESLGSSISLSTGTDDDDLTESYIDDYDDDEFETESYIEDVDEDEYEVESYIEDDDEYYETESYIEDMEDEEYETESYIEDDDDYEVESYVEDDDEYETESYLEDDFETESYEYDDEDEEYETESYEYDDEDDEYETVSSVTDDEDDEMDWGTIEEEDTNTSISKRTSNIPSARPQTKGQRLINKVEESIKENSKVYTDLIDFVLDNPNCLIRDAQKHFSEKEIKKQIKLGKVFLRGGKLSV